MRGIMRFALGILALIIFAKLIGIAFAIGRLVLGMVIILGIGAAITGRFDEYVRSLTRTAGSIADWFSGLAR